MKKFLKVLVVALFMLSMSLSLVGCGSISSMKNAYDKKAYDQKIEESLYTEATKLSAIGSSYVFKGQVGDIAVFTASTSQPNGDVYYETLVYNLATGMNVITHSNYDEPWFYELIDLNGCPLVIMMDPSYMDADYATIEIYDGETMSTVQLSQEDGDEIIYNEDVDILVIGDSVYREKKGEIYITEYNDADVDSFEYTAGGYYFAEKSGSEDLLVYNKDLELIGKAKVPSYAYDNNILVLENGNVLIQYTYVADNYGDDYDFIDNGTKYKLVTELFNAKSATQKEIKCEYIIAEQITDKNFKDGVCIASVYEIKNKRIADSESDTLIANISNNGKISVYNKAQKQLVNAYLEMMPYGNFIAGNYEGREVLLDSKLNVIGTYDNVRWCGPDSYLADGKIYDYNGNVIIDLAKEDYEASVSTTYASLILTKKITYGANDQYTTTERYLYRDALTGLELIASTTTESSVTIKSTITVSNKSIYYKVATTSDTRTITVYSANGDVLAEKSIVTTGSYADYNLSFSVKSDNVIAFSYSTYDTVKLTYKTVYEYYVVK